MGTFRLLLAFAVLYSHAFGLLWGRDTGIIAVISFFAISGYVMAGLFTKYYAQPFRPLPFYADRAGRLLPQYLFYLLVTVALMIAGIPNINGMSLRWDSVPLAAMVFPLDYFMLTGRPDVLINMPAWSLGLEATFYLVLPYLMLMNRRWVLPLGIASILVFIAATSNAMNTDYYAYRLLPGTLFIFLAGIAFYYNRSVLALGLLLAPVAFVLIAARVDHAFKDRIVPLDLACGLALAASLVFIRRLRFTRMDELLGNLSYGVFLSHWPLLMLADAAGLGRVVVPFAALVAAALSYYAIERPALAWRRRLRSGRAAKTQSPAAIPT